MAMHRRTLRVHRSYAAWKKQLATHAYEHGALNVLRCALVGAVSKPGAAEGELRARKSRWRCVKARRGCRSPTKKIRATFCDARGSRCAVPKTASNGERGQLSEQKMQTALSVGSSVDPRRIARPQENERDECRTRRYRGAQRGRIGRESGDVDRAQESFEVVQQRRGHTELESEFAAETEKAQGKS